jgi:hypothetical protein
MKELIILFRSQLSERNKVSFYVKRSDDAQMRSSCHLKWTRTSDDAQMGMACCSVSLGFLVPLWSSFEALLPDRLSLSLPGRQEQLAQSNSQRAYAIWDTTPLASVSRSASFAVTIWEVLVISSEREHQMTLKWEVHVILIEQEHQITLKR